MTVTKSLFVRVGLIPLLVGAMTTLLSADEKSNAATGRLLRHVVLIKFKTGTTSEQIREIEAAMTAADAEVMDL